MTERIDIMPDSAPPLFAIAPTPPEGEPGPLEAAVRREIEGKVAAGIIDLDLWAGQVTQAVQLAAEIDRSVGVGRPSGRASIHDVLHRLLFDLPQPEQQAGSSDLDRALEAIMSSGDPEP